MNNNALIEMHQRDFDTLDDRTLGWKCIEPAIREIQGKNLTIKSQVYAQLTAGQKSLLLFWILYGHTQYGVIQFFNEMDYLLTGRNIWVEFRHRLQLFEMHNLPDLINEMESIYQAHVKEFSHTLDDMNSVAQKAARLDAEISEIMPDVFKKIAEYIRNNPDDFVHLID